MSAPRVLAAATSALLLLSSVGQVSAQLPVTDGLLAWFDATDPSTVFEDDFLQNQTTFGGPAGGWKDKGPFGFEAFQSDLTRQPTYVEEGINGLPSIRFTGAEADGMEFLGLELFRPYTAFIVNQYSDSGPSRGRTLQSADINWLLGLWSNNVGHYAEGWVSAPGGSLPATVNTPYVADAIGDLTSSRFFLNGEEFTADPNPVGDPGALGLVSVGSFPGEVSDADISEIILFERVLEQSELDSVRNYLYQKYGTEPYEPPPPPMMVVHAGQVGTFTGADPGEGLDFEGEFVYALNVGGPGENEFFEPVTVGDAVFEDASEVGLLNPGVTITDANEILDWHAPEYGDSPDDDNLELAMQSIRWNVPPGLDVTLDVEEGQFYQVQLLFAESCCNRGFDIFIEGEEVVEDFVVQVQQGGINNTSTGVVYTHTVQATDSLLEILLGGSAPVPDNNPILNAITLELVDGPPPMDLLGDYNGNGRVEQADLDLVLLNWGTALAQPWVDGTVDQAELDGVLLNWGNEAALGSAAGVPEPSTIVLVLAVAGLACGLFRRRQA